jgi:hypothetical protein
MENPKFNLGCAKWCEHARDCLGYDPKAMDLEGEGEASLVERLIVALKEELKGEAGGLTHAIRALEFAREILRREVGNPKTTLIASLLHDLAVREAHVGRAGEPPRARRIMEEAGLPGSTIEDVCRLVGCEHSRDALETPESRIAWDADRLAHFAGEDEDFSEGDASAYIEKRFRTEAGKDLARREWDRKVGSS